MLDTKAVIIQKNTSNESSYNMLGGQAFASYWKMGLFCGHTESWGRPCSKDGEFLSLTLTLSR